jgi:putative transcriptional regulator
MKNRLKALRQLRQWSQSDLARELGVSRQAINGFESGKFDPSLDMAFRLSHLFDVAIQDIFTHTENRPMQTLLQRFTNFIGFDFGFERFTEPAIAAVKFAHNCAGKSDVGPEHLLTGLLADPNTIAAQLLQASGATLPTDIAAQDFESRSAPRFNAESKFVMEMALQIVRLQGQKSIGTEHLLWGLTRLSETGNSTATEAFQQSGINLTMLNQQLITAI